MFSFLKYRIFLLTMMLVIVHSIFGEQCKGKYVPTLASVEGALFGCAVGDAMGRPTEFKELSEIFERYPDGIHSFTDFHLDDFTKDVVGRYYAPFTDDTAMTMLVAKELAWSRMNHVSLDETMGAIAMSFVRNRYEKDGWSIKERAPGKACLSGADELENRMKNGLHKKSKEWWDTGSVYAGGCGSVMRAAPFGMVYYDDPDKAIEWAAAHSRLTHGAPCACAACAAMAVGVALILQGSGPEVVVSAMEQAAYRYDRETACMIGRVVSLAHEKTIDHPSLQVIFERSREVFQKYQGWSASEAIAAAVYIFTAVPCDIRSALYLGVHTPGDSDSIASIAGTLVGAYVGIHAFPQEWIDIIEKSHELDTLGLCVWHACVT